MSECYVRKWVIEEKDREGNVLMERYFDSYEEASDLYQHLKEASKETNISLYKSQKYLLLD